MTFYRQQWLFVVGGMSFQSRSLDSWHWWRQMISGRLVLYCTHELLLNVASSTCNMFSVLCAGISQQPDPEHSQSGPNLPPSPALPTDSTGSLIIFRTSDTWPSNKSPRSLFKLGSYFICSFSANAAANRSIFMQILSTPSFDVICEQTTAFKVE